jgi:hypothetical protein
MGAPVKRAAWINSWYNLYLRFLSVRFLFTTVTMPLVYLGCNL